MKTIWRSGLAMAAAAVMAAGTFIAVTMPSAAWSDERTRFKVNPIPPSDRLENAFPLPVMGPPAPAYSAPVAEPVSEPVPAVEPEPAPATGE